MSKREARIYRRFRSQTRGKPKIFCHTGIWLIVRDVSVTGKMFTEIGFLIATSVQNPILRIPVQRMGASVDVNGTAKGLAIGSWST